MIKELKDFLLDKISEPLPTSVNIVQRSIPKIMMTEFSQAVCEKIGYYVYILKDPSTSTIFYVGKGIGSRVFQHIAGALTSPAISDKLNLIKEIHNAGFEIEHYILRHGLTQELSFEI